MKGDETGKQPRSRGRFQGGEAGESRALRRTLAFQCGALQPGGPGLSPPALDLGSGVGSVTCVTVPCVTC